MSAILVNGNVVFISKLTAALLDDTGFYESVDYSMSTADTA